VNIAWNDFSVNGCLPRPMPGFGETFGFRPGGRLTFLHAQKINSIFAT
jgi:hypothetical protein